MGGGTWMQVGDSCWSKTVLFTNGRGHLSWRFGVIWSSLARKSDLQML